MCDLKGNIFQTMKGPSSGKNPDGDGVKSAGLFYFSRCIQSVVYFDQQKGALHPFVCWSKSTFLAFLYLFPLKKRKSANKKVRIYSFLGIETKQCSM